MLKFEFQSSILFCSSSFLNEMARRKLFSPRTKTMIKSLSTRYDSSERFRSSRRKARVRQDAECVQVRGTLCVGVSQRLRTELWQTSIRRQGIHTTVMQTYNTLLTKAKQTSSFDMTYNTGDSFHSYRID